MSPPFTVAASFVPSAEEVIPPQSFVPPVMVTSVQVAPLSLEVQMLPLYTAAASFVPSAEEVIHFHIFLAPIEVTSVQVLPLSLEVHMLVATEVIMLLATAANLSPSSEEEISDQGFGSIEVTSVQVDAEEAHFDMPSWCLPQRL